MQTSSHESIKSSSSIQQQQSIKQSIITSLRHQCLEYLRFPTSITNNNSKPKTHLLAYMSEFINDQPKINIQEIDDYCCLQRMKKIVDKKPYTHQTNQQNALENQKLIKYIQIQSKIKKMQQNLMKNPNNNPNKKQPTTPTHPKNIPPKKSFQKTQQFSATTTQPNQHIHQTLLSRYSIQKTIRDEAYKHYFQHQRKKKVQNEHIIKQSLQKQIQQKIKHILQQRDIKYNQLINKIKSLQQCIIQKNLQLQNIKNKQIILNKNIYQLQIFKDLFQQNHSFKQQQKSTLYQSFYHQFFQYFPQFTIKSLHQYINTIINQCLEKFHHLQQKKSISWNQQKTNFNQKISKLQNIISKYKANQNNLLNNIKQIKYQQNQSSIEMDTLIKNQSQLQHLQKKILSLYNDWYGQLSQSQKQVMKSRGYLQTTYGYEQMLEYIAVFKKKFSTNEKVNQYLIKLLRGIQRIRKILFPKSVSNSEYKKQIMDPLIILQKIEKYMKNKVFQIQKKNNWMKESRVSQIIEEEFLCSEENHHKDKQNDIPNQETNVNNIQQIENTKKQNMKKSIVNSLTIKKQNK